jgi:hypothetical protein
MTWWRPKASELLAPWQAGWQRVALATTMLVSMMVFTGLMGTMVVALGADVQRLDSLPPWVRALLGAAMLAVGAYIGVVVTRPFIAEAKQVGFIVILAAVLVGATIVVPRVSTMLGRHDSAAALCVFILGLWTTCFAATLVRLRT